MDQTKHWSKDELVMHCAYVFKFGQTVLKLPCHSSGDELFEMGMNIPKHLRFSLLSFWVLALCPSNSFNQQNYATNLKPAKMHLMYVHSCS